MYFFHFFYFSTCELETIFSTLLHTHFITPDTSSAVTAMNASTAHHLGIHDEQVSLLNMPRKGFKLVYITK